jgi:hypothetical protein
MLECHEPRKEREYNRLLRTIKKLEEDRSNSTRFWRGIRLKDGDHCYLHGDAPLA